MTRTARLRRATRYLSLLALSKPVFALTTPSNRNPQGVTMPRDLRPVAAGVVEVARATFIFHLLSVLCSLFSRTGNFLKPPALSKTQQTTVQAAGTG